MAYLYRHIRVDKNEPFYIGIGSDISYIRANDFKEKRRNILWNRIYSKTTIEVDIILDNLTWKEACEKEIEFIKLYGRKDKKLGCLCNLTDGGDGSFGVIISDENKKKLSERNSGVNNPMYGKKLSKESIAKMVAKKEGIPCWNKDKKGIYSDESLKKMSDAKKGSIAWNKGLKNVNGNGMGKIVLDFNTGIFYNNAKEASLSSGLKHTTLKSKLNGSNKNETAYKYV